MKKRIVSIILCVVLLCSSISALGLTASAASYRLSFESNTNDDVRDMPSLMTGASEYYIPDKVPTRFLYTFLGWSESKTAKEPDWYPGNSITLTQKTTLYAVWDYCPSLVIGIRSKTIQVDFPGQERWLILVPDDAYESKLGAGQIWSTGGYNPTAKLYDDSGTLLEENDDIEGASLNDTNFRILYGLTRGKTYYLSVSASVYNSISPDSFTVYVDRIQESNRVTFKDGSYTFREIAQFNNIAGIVPWETPNAEVAANFLGWAKNPNNWDLNSLYQPGQTLEYRPYTLYAIWDEPWEIRAGASCEMLSKIQYGTQVEWYSFTPKVSSTYHIYLKELSEKSLGCTLTDWGFGNIEDQMSLTYNDSTRMNDYSVYLSANQVYYIGVGYWLASLEADYESGDYELAIGRTATLSYNANGGSGAPASQSGSYKYTISTLTPTRAGYTFYGWNTSSDPGTDDLYYNPGDTIIVNAAATLYAQWSQNPNKTVTFDAKGGIVSPLSKTVPSGSSITLPTPSKSYTLTYHANGGTVSSSSKTVTCAFRNWNANSSGTGTSYNAGASYTINADATLYAQWTNPTAGTLATPTRNGYTFDGWYTSSSGGSKITSSSTISANTTIYAHWTPNPSYTVSLNPNGGSVTPTSMPVPATLPTPSKSYTITYNANGGSVSTSSKTVNCIFRNWNSNSSGSGSSYSAGAYYNVSANTTLYAQWTNPIAGTLATPSRSGYTFDGWYTASSGGNKITSSSTISANTTLYAHWTPIPTNDYTITFDAQGGSVSPTSRTVTSGTTITLPSPSKSYTITFNANGGSVSTSSSPIYCSFRNWNTYSSGTGTSYNAGTNYTVYSNTTLYAQWTNPTAGSLPSASRSGYTFDGWYTSSSGGSRITSSSTISANTTLYAHWTYIPVTAVGCDIVSAPNKTNYIYKENTDTSGTVLSIRYSDGTTKTVSDTSRMTFSRLTTSSVGTKTVSVTCEGVSASFNITVRYAWWQRLIRVFLLGFLWY